MQLRGEPGRTVHSAQLHHLLIEHASHLAWHLARDRRALERPWLIAEGACLIGCRLTTGPASGSL
jgi:hypothetical protein